MNISLLYTQNLFFVKVYVVIGEKEMYLLDIFQLGLFVSRTFTLRVGSIVIGKNDLTGNLKEILDILRRNSIATENHYMIEGIIEKLEKEYDKKNIAKNKLTQKTLIDLNYSLNAIYSIILANIRDRVIFSAFTDGDLNITKLCKGAKMFFNEDVWKNLQEIEKKDLEDCVKCLLTENWTPAGVMAMRVIESAVREYYFKLTNERKTQWWKILDELKSNQNADQDLVKELDYIREHIRNPLAHPEDRIETHREAEKVYLHAIELLSKIYS